MGSSRLPRKPLVEVAGHPLIEWVWRQVSESGVADRVVVATDHDAIAKVVSEAGGEVAMTDPAHPSGTDRVAEVAARPDYAEAEVILNVQGDEPFLASATLDAAVRLVAHHDWEVGTLATRLSDVVSWRDPSQVKVVRGDDGRALYFSRAPIPHRRDGAVTADVLAAGAHLRHVGVYSYRRAALMRWVGLPEHPLERLERLEQLRPLAAGIRIGVAEVAADPHGIDTPEDVTRAEAIFAERASQTRTDRR